MKTLVKTKLLEGKYAELRDYELFRDKIKIIYCKSQNYKSCFHLNDQYMYLTVAQQKEGKVTNTQQSKFPPYSYYKMYKYLWKPYQESLDTKPSIDSDVRVKLADEFFKRYPELRKR